MKRRSMIGLAGAGVAGIAATGGVLAMTEEERQAPAASGDAIPFYGVRQAGIVTPAQDRLHFVAFDVTTSKRAELVAMLENWTAAAARMTAGLDAGTIGAVGGIPEAPPDDTGEAIGLPASGLTLTIGFGPSLFRKFGLSGQRPEALEDLPHFPGDAIDPKISGGDICIQACSHDPQVAVHAVRNLARLGMGVVSVRWSQLGFGRTSSTSTSQATPRNLFGFKDGTANLKAEETALLDEHLWVRDGDGPAWLTGGSYLVSRKIRMVVETWDRTPLGEQEAIVGRTKGTGAPLSGGQEFDEPDLSEKSAIPVDAHVRLAHPTQNQGARLLRRGYNFVDGSDGLGRLNAGLFFLAYQRDPRRGFIPVQTSLARRDSMNEYIRHVSSGIFACPPGLQAADDFWGRSLLA
ncbi:iron uptake transporter deferrochelatase/peroxidase subunit [Actinoplanes missouriensis]|uniref:iron uptake transporter deferrochelatase/peroxidase subunit n=1 Tax=Actinoplanes missouriensis TaxID=1866 RepID=UPI0033CFA7F1